LEEGVEFSKLLKLKVKERISRMKFIDEKEEEKFDLIEEEMEKQIEATRKSM
jgi:vacuolar-type H+-ATPase catalytic subunit A/Vma1